MRPRTWMDVQVAVLAAGALFAWSIAAAASSVTVAPARSRTRRTAGGATRISFRAASGCRRAARLAAPAVAGCQSGAGGTTSP